MKNYFVKDIINSRSAISPGKGLKLYEFIKSEIQDKEPITLSFNGIEEVVTAFANASIGKLYLEFDMDYLDKMLLFKDLSPIWERKIQQARELGSDESARKLHKDNMNSIINS